MQRLSIDEQALLREGHAYGHHGTGAVAKPRSASKPQTATVSKSEEILREKTELEGLDIAQDLAISQHNTIPPPPLEGDAEAPAAHTREPPSVSSDSSSPSDGPPSLEYTVKTRKRIIFLTCFWTLVILDSIGFPIGLYFGLTYGLAAKPDGEPRLTPNAVFSIVTAAIGGVSIIEYFMRSWRLWKKSSTARVIGAEGRKRARWWFDWFHVVFTSTWLVLMVELIVGSTPKLPPIRLVAMPPASLLYCFGCDMAVRELFRYKGWRYPIRISSQPRGAVLLPAIYPFIEDIVAADGGGGTAYRERLARRYHSSHVFRSMLERMTVFWTAGCLFMATLTTILIFTLEADWGYAVGWSVPFVWAMVWTLLTWWYVEHTLKVERRTWNVEKPEA